jgi:hypothetical protein
MLMDPQGCKPPFDGVILLDAYMLNDVDAPAAGEDDEQVPVSTPNGSAQVGARSRERAKQPDGKMRARGRHALRHAGASFVTSSTRRSRPGLMPGHGPSPPHSGD